MGPKNVATRMAVALFLSSTLLPAAAMADTWRDANRESVELYRAGNLRSAASAAERAAELYEDSENYTPANHTTLSLQAAQMYDQADNLRKASSVLRSTISHVQGLYPAGHVSLTSLWMALSEIRFDQGAMDRAIQARHRMIEAAKQVHGDGSAEVARLWIAIGQWIKPHKGATATRQYLSNARIIMEGNYELTHPVYVLLDMEYAKLRLELEDYSVAEGMYQALLTRVEAMESPNPALMNGVYGQLAYLYSNTGREGELLGIVERLARFAPSESGQARPVVMIYPDMLGGGGYRMAHEVSVTFDFSVDAEGRPFNIEIVETSGNGTYEAAARDALEESRFVPGLQNGQTVAIDHVRWNYYYEFPQSTPVGTRISRRQ